MVSAYENLHIPRTRSLGQGQQTWKGHKGGAPKQGSVRRSKLTTPWHCGKGPGRVASFLVAWLEGRL